MTHDAVRALLPAYAKGRLGTSDADAVRAHLAAGCTPCLDQLFRLPIGLPRTAEPNAAPPAPVESGPLYAAPAVGRSRTASAVGHFPGVTLIVLALGLVGLAAWAIATMSDLRQSEVARAVAETRAVAERAAAEATRVKLAERLDALGRELETARREAAAQRATSEANSEAIAALKRDLQAAESRMADLTRSLKRREDQIDQLLTDVEEERRLRELVASPGLEFFRLRPVAPFREGRGHVLWHPRRSDMLLYAFGLPRPAGGRSYRVRVTLDDGTTVAGPSLYPGLAGGATAPIRLDASGEHLRAVEILLDPGARPVLAGRPGPG